MIAALGLLCTTAHAQPAAALDLFDGRTLAGWEGNLNYWRVEEGSITGEIPAGQRLTKNEWIFWKGEVHDFVFTAEFRISGVPLANSGIQFRSQRRPDGGAAGYQADLDAGATWLGRIFDEHGRGLLAERGTRNSIAPDGRRLVDTFAKPNELAITKAPGEWSTYRIIASGPHMEVWVDDVLCATLDDHEISAADYSGVLGLQLHSRIGPVKVQFRNLRLTHTGRTAFPAAPPSTKRAEVPSIKPIGPDGKTLNLDFETGTLDGWKMEGDAWEGQPRKPAENATARASLSQHQGTYWIGNIPRDNDTRTGRLSSPPFEVTHRWGSFLIGGIDDPAVRVEVVDATSGKIIKAVEGTGSVILRRESVDFGDALGRQVFVRLVDEAKGAPFIAFDDFVFHPQNPGFDEVYGGAPGRLQQSAALWHLRPNPAKPTNVGNSAAQKIVAGMSLMSGFQVELIAADPDVRQPIAFAIDPRGRLWVAEAHNYPTRAPTGQGRDRVVIFEDANGDGTFETRKVFIEGLNLISGLELGFGGMWVGTAPELLFIPDRNGDDRPDGPAQVLLDGWGYQDTHETLNSFTWGPDGWLYGTQGVFTSSRIGKPGTVDSDRLPLRAGVWRYHPTRHQFEIFAQGGSNPWGLDFNDAGHFFMTHCRSLHGGGGTTHVIRSGHFWNQANSGYADFISNAGAPFAFELKNFLPASARFDSGEGGAGKAGTTAMYGGHSHVGTLIYQGDNWPEIYRGHLFTHNLHGHQLNHQVNVRVGSAYETFHAGYDMLYAPDPTYMAVDLQTGPDGAVYTIDWTDRQHCHSRHDERWDRSNGRIYRIAWAETYRPVQVNLAAQSDEELVRLHLHRNEWFVRTARRLLQERAATRPLAAKALAELRRQASAAPDSAAALRAYWTLHGAGVLAVADLTAMLAHSHETVRAWGVQLATEQANDPRVAAEQLVTLAEREPSALVRLALASALPFLPAEPRWQVVERLAAQAEDSTDRFLPKLIWTGLAPVATSSVDRALGIARATKLPALSDSILWYLGRSSAGRDALISAMLKEPPKWNRHALRLIGFALRSERAVALPAGWAKLQARVVNEADVESKAILQQLAGAFRDEAALAEARARIMDESAPIAERMRALGVLKRAGDVEDVSRYVRLFDQPAFRSAVLPLLAGANDSKVGEMILRYFPKLAPSDQAVALSTMTSRTALAVPLLGAVRSRVIDPQQITPLLRRQLANLRDAGIDREVATLWSEPAAPRGGGAAPIITKFKNAFEAATPSLKNPDAGREVFQRVCASCHALKGQGGRLGPDLTGSARNGLDYFLENIVDPSAVVGADFQLQVVTKTDGSVVSGTLDRQSDTGIVLRTLTESVAIPADQIKRREVLPQSSMPAGLLEALPEKEAIALLAYLLTQ